MNLVDTRHSPYTRLTPVPMGSVTLVGGFWGPRWETTREVTLPEQYGWLERTGRLDNFRRAAGDMALNFQGYLYNDSDVYKWLEAACWMSAQNNRDPTESGESSNGQLAGFIEGVIKLISTAQQADGYLDTYFSLDKSDRHWSNLRDQHELYCAGHLIQAAIAAQRSAGDARLLGVARRLADHIGSVFGLEEHGLRPGVPGHPEIEMALVELARECREPRYLEQAAFFLDQRGRGLIGGQVYHLDHLPYRQLPRLAGHAVRALYLSAGAADLYAEIGEPDLWASLERLWEQLYSNQVYITGGLGARYSGESLAEDYELPNQRAYAESCAAIASLMWNWRLLLVSGEARYADALETALYNGALSGISLDGKSYFYQNPLADGGSHRRQPWFECACCPTNLVRMLAMLPGYAFSLSERGVWMHLYTPGRLCLPAGTNGTAGDETLALEVNTNYPWDGDVEVEIQSTGESRLSLRIPSWVNGASSPPHLEVNGMAVDVPLFPGSYAEVRRNWKPGDILRLHLPLETRWMESHPYVPENLGRLALQRGPLVYCFEGADNPRVDLRSVTVQPERPVLADYRHDLLGGVTALQVEATRRDVETGWSAGLYRPFRFARGQEVREKPEANLRLTAIPYYAWANRAPGQMQVWMASGRKTP